MAVIDSVIWAPESPAVGDSVKIDVCGPGGQPYANMQQEYVAIDGVAGSQQYVQFVWPGVHQVIVTAVGSDGTPEQSTVSINIAAPQAASAAGTRAVVIGAGQPQATEAALLEAQMNIQILTVASPPQGVVPYAVTFALQPVSALVTPPPSVAPGSPVPAAPAAPVPTARAAEPMVTTALPRAESGLMDAKVAISTLSTQLAPPNLAPLERFEWDFGDGSPSVKTVTPQAAHDFGPALGTEQEFQQFHVTITDLAAAGTPSYTRTLSVMNAYVMCKKWGYVVPEVGARGWARKVATNFVGTAVFSNREPVDLVLVSRQLIPILADPTVATVPSPLEPLGAPVTVPAGGSVTVQVIAPFSAVPENALGFSAVFTDQPASSSTVVPGPSPIRILEVATGMTSKPADQSVPHATTAPAGPTVDPVHLAGSIAGLKIRATAHFQIQPEDRLSDAPRVGAISISRVADNPELISEILGTAPPGLLVTHAGSPAAAGAAPRTQLLNLPIARTGTTTPINVTPATGTQGSPIAVGSPCDPDNPPDNVPSGLVCQLTQPPQTETVATPAQFLNARKGDLVLAPGGNGLIGGLLTQVTPPQTHSHSGIMTLNHQQITHCTASQERLQAYPTGGNWLGGEDQPLGGFEPNAVKYGWPGVITQAVDQATGSQALTDPDSGVQYTINGSFNTVPSGATIAGKFTIIPPLVIKPDPLLETTAIRSLLGKVADDAYAQTGKAHYRFYCYTNPAIGEDPASVAPAGTGWAVGTFPAVCSSFIWLMMKRNGVEAEGPNAIATQGELGPQAAAAGVQLGPDTPDGLFFYPQAERETAGNWLYNSLYNMAYQQAGWLGLGEDLTKAGVHIGNQICNAFANDDCSAENDSTAWQTPGDANAVSPDNLTAWNSPDRGGALGYVEPLIFQSPRIDTVPVYQWANSPLMGTLHGHVTFNGQPAGSVTLQLSSFYAFSQADGSYSFANVPYGSYELKAQQATLVGPQGQQTTQYLSTQQQVSIESPAVTQNVALQLPNADYRQIVVTGSMNLNCTKKAWFVQTSSDNATVPFIMYLNVGPYGTHAFQSAPGSVDSATADLDVTIDWQVDNSVNISFNGRLDGNVANWGTSFTLSPDAWRSYQINLSGNDDSAVIQVTFANNVQPS